MDFSNPTGRFTRFLNDKNKYSSNGVKPRAFFPKSGETHTSVYLTENLIESDVWDLGHKYIKPTVEGRADLDACEVYKIDMCITIDDKLTGHANLGPFPKVTAASDKEKKDMRLHIASKLAYISKLSFP
jgi:hypothetical protein